MTTRRVGRRWAPWVFAVALAGHAASTEARRFKPRELFGEPELQRLIVSPSGGYLAAITARGPWDQAVVRLRNRDTEVVALRRVGGIRRIQWIDERHLLVSIGMPRHPTYHVVTVSTEDGELQVREEPIRARGRFVSLLPAHEGEVLWDSHDLGESSVYRLPFAELMRSRGTDLAEREGTLRVAHLPGRVEVWTPDRDGVVRAGLTGYSTDRGKLWYRRSAESEWVVLVDSGEPEEFPLPLGVSANGRDLVVASKAGGDTWALFELSGDTGELGRELFAHSDADVVDVVYHPLHAGIIGVIYEREGLEEFHFFDSYYEHHQRALERAFPGVAVKLISVTHDQRVFTVLVRGPRDPGVYFVLDVDTNVATEVGQVMPWLAPEHLADVVPLRVVAPDGMELEAFVARPNEVERPALVVLPHGGPLGVRDTRAFDPLVQYLANAGLAVLQVNYRGSGGRGDTFLEAGKRQWAKGIEDDIDAAVDRVLELGWADGDRICIAGGSYGGYSALMSVVRRPDRYRCAASLNGPTDVPLLYWSWMSHSEAGREFFAEYVGDPESEHERLREISPVYRAGELRVPIHLAQSTEDRRVDVEHYHRLKALLEALGREHETYVIEGGHHAPTTDEWIDYLPRLRTFLLRHLGGG